MPNPFTEFSFPATALPNAPGTLLSRKMPDRLSRGFVNVFDWTGVVGNGTNDDTAGITNCINRNNFRMTVQTGTTGNGNVVFTQNIPQRYVDQPYAVWCVINITDPTSLVTSGNGVSYNIGKVNGPPAAANTIFISNVATSIDPGDVIEFEYSLKGSIFFPAARYKITAPIPLSRGPYTSYCLIGEGDATWIEGNFAGYLFDQPFNPDGPISGTRIVDGFKFSNTHAAGGCLRMNSAISGNISNNEFSGFRGVEITNMQSTIIYNNRFGGGGLGNAIGIMACDNCGILYNDITGLAIGASVAGFGVTLEGNRFEVNDCAIVVADSAIMGVNRGSCQGLRISGGSMESNNTVIDFRGGVDDATIENFIAHCFPGAGYGGVNPRYGIRIPDDKASRLTIKSVSLGSNYTSAAIYLGESSNRTFNIVQASDASFNDNPKVYYEMPVGFDIAGSRVTGDQGGLLAGTQIVFVSNGDTLPTPLSFGTVYWLLDRSNAPGVSGYRISATEGGSALTFSGTHSGTHKRRQPVSINISTGVFTLKKHNFNDDTVVRFAEDNSNTLPLANGASMVGKKFYMMNTTADTFKIGGHRDAVNFGGAYTLSGSQSGMHLIQITPDGWAMPITAHTVEVIHSSYVPVYKFSGLPTGTNARKFDTYWIDDGAKSGGGSAVVGDQVQGSGSQTLRVVYNGTVWKCVEVLA